MLGRDWGDLAGLRASGRRWGCSPERLCPPTLQMTQRCRFSTASVTVLPPASSRSPGLCCSCRSCCCKPCDAGCHVQPKDWNRAEKAEAGTLTCPEAQPQCWEPLPPNAQAATRQPQNGSVLRVSTHGRSASLGVPSLPPPQKDRRTDKAGQFSPCLPFQPLN